MLDLQVLPSSGAFLHLTQVHLRDGARADVLIEAGSTSTPPLARRSGEVDVVLAMVHSNSKLNNSMFARSYRTKLDASLGTLPLAGHEWGFISR